MQSWRVSHRVLRNHHLWALEYLAEMGGRRFPVEFFPAEIAPPQCRGRLVVTVHRGQWISGARALAERAGPIDTVAGVQLLRSFQADIDSFSRSIGVRLHRSGTMDRTTTRADDVDSSATGRSPAAAPVEPMTARSILPFRGGPAPGVLPELERALRAGGTVVLHIDGHPHPERCRNRASGPPIGVRAAALLAAHTQCEVVASVCDRMRAGNLRLSWERVQVGNTRDRRAWESALQSLLVRWVEEDPSAWILFDPRPLGCGGIFQRAAREVVP